MTTQSTTVEVDRALKERHRAMWASGDYPAVADEVVGDLGPRLVAAVGPVAGRRVLDVAAGSGNASLPAVRAGAEVVASDLVPELLDAGRDRAEAAGLDLQWRVADAEALPFPDASFDVLLSCLGVMFAPHHQAAADELLRVTRPGGTIGLLSWTPEGFIGQMFATIKQFAAPPPPGVQPPPRWGDPEHVRALLGAGVSDLVARRESLRVYNFRTPEQFREYFKARYGPTLTLYRGLADAPDRVAALDQALDDLAREHLREPGVMSWEYLVVTARRAG
jgi:SAM-dependent methyltransferase